MSEAIRIAEVVFVDANVTAHSADWVEGLQAQGRQVVVLDPSADGLAQMVASLSGLTGLDAIHLVSHGSSGQVWLGGQSVGAQDLAASASQWSSLGQALRPGGDFLLYGCDVSQGAAGQAFVAELARLTGASVAASDDASGPSALGGDQELEVAVGSIEAASLDLQALGTLLAAPAISNLDASITFEEGGAPIPVDNDITFTGGGAYTEGFVRFAVSSSNVGDQFTLTSAADPNASGAISVNGADVYLGNGSGRDRIGSVDPVENGRNGQPLKVLFSSPLPNSGFEEGEANWSVRDEQYGDGPNEINFDNYIINRANNSDSNSTYTGGTGTVNIQPPDGMSFSGSVASGVGIGGSKALFLSSAGDIGRTDQDAAGPFKQDGYGSIHGPYATSSVIKVQSGDSISLEFKAVGSGDDYEVFGLLRRVDSSGNFISNAIDANNIVLFAERGADTAGFRTVTATGLPSGDYRFEFVGGTYDGSGGLAVGSNLYVDNIRLVSSTAVGDAVVNAIARQVEYQSTATDSPPSRTVTVTATNQAGETSSATTTLNITQANNAPSFTGPATLAAAPEDSTPAGATVASLFGTLYSDPDASYTPADTLAGIVLTANTADPVTQGAWQYSTDAGTTWLAVGAVSSSAGLVLSTAAMLRFLPAPNYNGTPGGLSAHAVDSTYGGAYTAGATRRTFDTTTDDGESAVAAAPVGLGTSISPVNDAPTVTSAPVTLVRADTVAVDAYAPATGTLTAVDVDGDAVVFGIVGGTVSGGVATRALGYGTLSVNTTTGAYVFTPDAVAINALPSGMVEDSFTITVGDGSATSSQVFTFRATGANDLPVAVGDTGYAVEAGGEGNEVEGAKAKGNVLDNDHDPDTGSSFTVSAISQGARTASPGQQFSGQYGVIVLKADGSYVYLVDESHPAVNALKSGATLEDQFSYTLRDDQGGTSVGTLNIVIGGANEAPTPRPDVVIAVEDRVNPQGNVLANDVDPDAGDALEVANPGQHVGRYGTLTLAADGQYRYVLDPASPEVQALSSHSTTLSETFTYTVKDLAGRTATSTLTIEIQGTNDAPVGGAPMGVRPAQVGQALDLQLPTDTIVDPDGPAEGLRYSVALSDGRPAPAWLRIDPVSGRLSGTPAPGDEGVLKLSITVTDLYQATLTLDWVTLDVRAADGTSTNAAPVFTSEPRVDVPEGSTVVTVVRASDADGDRVTYGIAGGSDAASFRIDAATGELRFVRPRDFESAQDADGDNVFQVIISASDDRGGLVQRLHTIELKDVVEAPNADADGDGVPDVLEQGRDTDGDGLDDSHDADDDGDGIDTADEAQVPGILPRTQPGDGNGDGVSDSLQSHVASRPLTDAQGRPDGYATLAGGAAGDGVRLLDFGARDAGDSVPPGAAGPREAWGFEALLPEAGARQVFELYLPGDQSFTGLWMQDAQGQWQQVPATAERVGDRWKISFEATDGGALDADGMANGRIDSLSLMATGRDGLAVHRFTHDGLEVQFHTADAQERSVLIAQSSTLGWSYEGVAFLAPVAEDTVQVWRFFHEASGDHFYTATPAERDALIEGDFGYQYEGASFQVYSEPQDGAQALHRYFSLDSADHVYTIDPADHAGLIGAGYAYEGILGYVFA